MSGKKLFGTIIVLIALIFSQGILQSNLPIAYGAEPAKLKIYIGPTSVPADNKAYDIIVVQLQDSKNIPARAEQDTIISLSSSLTNVGTVDSAITIPKGSTYANAQFHSTFSPGSTTITAAASGYLTVQAKVTTIGPVPSTLAVYPFPPVIPADGASYPAIIVQLQDSAGSPARAPLEGLSVTLSCSNTAVGTVDTSVSIAGGNTYTVANFKSVALLPNQTGTANVIAVASGYSSKQTTITTQGMSTGIDNLSLKVFVGPSKIMADGITYEQVVAVQVQNSSGKIVLAPSGVLVTLSSSITEVGIVQPTISIVQSSNYALANFNSTFKSGTTTIIAAATDYKSSQQSLITIGPIPSKLAVYNVPSLLPADSRTYDAVRVQLQDSAGNPAKDPEGDITVYLFSSEPECGNVPSSVTIPFGESHADATFTSTPIPNSATITAQSSGYDSGQTKITTYLLDKFTLNVSVAADPASVFTGSQTTIKAYVTYNGTIPAPRNNVTFTSNKGGNFSNPKDEGDGYYTALFTAPSAQNNTVCTVTASVSKTGYNSTTGKTQLTLNPSSISSGAILLRVMEDNGNPVSEAAVIIQLPQAGSQIQNGITNQTGYVTFENLAPGSYSVQIAKFDYDTKNTTLQFAAGQTASGTVTLFKSAGFPWLIVVGAVVAIAVAVVAVYFFVIRKRREDSDET